jgi:GAF domain-containing protein
MPRDILLLRTLVELADNLVEDFDVVDVLTVLADRCVEVLDGVDEAGVMLAAPSGELKVVAASSEMMRVLELFELQAEEGPCVDSFQTGAAIVNQHLSPGNGRWPAFTRHAMECGFQSVHALPMRLRGRTIGALNLFCVMDVSLDETDQVAAQTLADVATITILQHRNTIDARALNDQLSQALTSRVVIEQAKGKISEAANVDMAQAFDRLRHHARSHNLRLSDLARDIASGAFPPLSLDPPKRRA